MVIKIRRLELQDQARWRELWEGYCRFYERAPNERVAAYLWSRIFDQSSSVQSIVAVDENNFVLGLANYVIHESTATLTPVCYLQDLFVDSKVRARGVGKFLIDWLLKETKAQKWSRLYWNTKENNYRARELYDKYVFESGFVKYIIKTDEN